jgi:hypothetical protein
MDRSRRLTLSVAGPSTWSSLRFVWDTLKEVYPQFSWLALLKSDEGFLVCGQNHSKRITTRMAMNALQSALSSDYAVTLFGRSLSDSEVVQYEWTRTLGTFSKTGAMRTASALSLIPAESSQQVVDSLINDMVFGDSSNSEIAIVDKIVNADYVRCTMREMYEKYMDHKAGRVHECDSECEKNSDMTEEEAEKVFVEDWNLQGGEKANEILYDK